MRFDKTISSEDRYEILELISRYAYTFDEDRIAEHVDLFLDGAEFSLYKKGSTTQIGISTSNTERIVAIQEVRSSPINKAG